MKNTRIEISLKTLFTIVGIIFGIFVVSQIMDILIMILISFVLMTAIQPLVKKLQQAKFSRAAAIITVYLTMIAVLVVALAVVLPPFVEQTTTLFLQLNIPKFPLLKQLSEFNFSVQDVPSIVSQLGGSLSAVVGAISSAFSVLFSVFTVLVMTLYFLLEREHLYKYASFLFRSQDRDDRGKHLFNRIEHALGSWVRGEFTLMVLIGLMTYIGLTLLGVPYALPLAILAGFLEALPNLGPTIAAIPAIIVAALMVSPVMGAVTAVLYMVIQAIENNIVVPQVMKNAVGINPLTSIVLILVGVRFGGVMGALLIIPLYIIIRVVIQEFKPEIGVVFSNKES